jgi:hypothetical protein
MAPIIDTNALADALVGSVKSEFADFLQANKEAAHFVEEVSLDYAKLMTQLQLASDDMEQARITEELRRVQNTLELEADDLGELTNQEVMKQIKGALRVALSFGTKMLVPMILAAI